MRQILHIFRKDLRHFWPEALIASLSTLAFAWLYPAQWLPAVSVRLAPGGLPLGSVSMQTVAGLVTALVPTTWFVLVIRVVQDECLVGERPYWFTRPYLWQNLLAAKLLFLAVFVVLPLALAQAWLLHAAGFTPLEHRAASAYLLALNCGAFLLPMVCLAVVTKNVLRATLTLLALAFLVVLIAGLAGDHLETVSLPISDRLSLPIVLVFGIASILTQYGTRKTWLSRSFLVAALVTLAFETGNPIAGSMVQSYYTERPDAIPVQISLPPAPPGATADHLPVVTAGENKTSLELHLPLAISGVPYGFWIVPDDAQINLIAQDGQEWTSPWHSVYTHLYHQGTEQGALSFAVDKSFLTRARLHPVKLVVSLALTQWEAQMPKRFTLPAAGDLVLPEFGICSVPRDDAGEEAPLRCRYPLHNPAKTLVTADVTQQPCPASGSTSPEQFHESAVTGDREADWADIGLTSVWSSTLDLAYYNNSDSDASAHAHLCPGATVSLTRYLAVRRAIYTFTATSVSIPR